MVQHLAGFPDSAGWAKLVAVLRAELDDAHDEDLVQGLDSIDTAIALRAHDALRGIVRLPAVLWLAIPISGLLRAVVEVASGHPEPASEVTQALAELARDSSLAPLADALGRIVAGERAASLADGLDEVASAVVTMILSHLPTP